MDPRGPPPTGQSNDPFGDGQRRPGPYTQQSFNSAQAPYPGSVSDFGAPSTAYEPIHDDEEKLPLTGPGAGEQYPGGTGGFYPPSG